MVANPKSGAAAIAQLKGFDRIRGILRQFLIEYRHGTVYIACHIILRWGEDFLASLVVARRARHEATPGPSIAKETNFTLKRITPPCGIRVNL
jgi:hypothetical protein